jgi:asparagine synthase (glutamine-hydrolysing)
MMKTLLHRGNDSFGIFINDRLSTADDLEELESKNLDSPVAIGFNLMKVLSVDVKQPIQISGGALSLDGEIYSEGSVVGIEEIVRKKSGVTGLNLCLDLVRSENGAYAASALIDDMILLLRDPLGLKPLSYGQSAEFYAAASEGKALKNVGVESPEFFPTGNVARITKNGIVFNPERTIVASAEIEISDGSPVAGIHQKLLDSVKACTSDTRNVAVAFSGGLDSGIIATLAKSLGRNITLISVGIKGSYDLDHASEAAHELNTPIISRAFSRCDLEQAARHVMWHIEDKNTMKVEVAIAIGWVAQVAAEEGYKVVLTGQGGDELFAGYAKFARVYKSMGPEAAKNILIRSVLEAHITNYVRDEQVSISYGVRLRHPFADWELTHLALSLPIEANLISENDPLRKRVLRKCARLAEVPESIVEAPKRAVQYGSGIHKALSEIARSRNLPLSQYLEKLYDEISWDRHPVI